MTPKQKPMYQTEMPYIYDKWGIMCVECGRCEAWIPNVHEGMKVKCPNCQWEFTVIE